MADAEYYVSRSFIIDKVDFRYSPRVQSRGNISRFVKVVIVYSGPLGSNL